MCIYNGVLEGRKMPVKDGAETRRIRLQLILDTIKGHKEGVDKKRLMGLIMIKTGLLSVKIEEYLQDLMLTNLIEIDEGTVRYID